MATNFTTSNISSINLKGIAYNLKSIPFHGTEAEWTTNSSYIPKAGEIVIYDIDSANAEIRIKIGDGATTVGALPFAVEPISDEEIDEICVDE